MSELGYGAEYRCAPTSRGFMPPASSTCPGACRRQYYPPTERGLEKQIAQKLDYLHELDKPDPRKRIGKTSSPLPESLMRQASGRGPGWA